MTNPSLSDIVEAVSGEYKVPASVIMAKDMRTLAVTHARHVAQYLACTITFMSKAQIAKAFNQRDHSVVFYAVNKISKLMTDSEPARDRINHLKQVLTK